MALAANRRYHTCSLPRLFAVFRLAGYFGAKWRKKWRTRELKGWGFERPKYSRTSQHNHHRNTLTSRFTTISVLPWNSCGLPKYLSGQQDQILKKSWLLVIFFTSNYPLSGNGTSSMFKCARHIYSEFSIAYSSVNPQASLWVSPTEFGVWPASRRRSVRAWEYGLSAMVIPRTSLKYETNIKTRDVDLEHCTKPSRFQGKSSESKQ